MLWRIIGGHEASLNKTAEHLKVNRSFLSQILHAKREISSNYIQSNKWAEIFAKYYADTWSVHKPEFEKAITRLPRRKGPASKEPNGDGTLAHVLWTIIGGSESNHSEAAHRLNISEVALSRIIRNTTHVTQNRIETRRWREVFKNYYPDSWARNKDAFEQVFSKLPPRRGRLVTRPDDNDSIGYSLWLILGGNKANLSEAAPRLHVDKTALARIVNGGQNISQNLVDTKKWREVFETYYTDTWRLHQLEFERQFSRLAKYRGRRAAHTADRSIKKMSVGTNSSLSKAKYVFGDWSKEANNLINDWRKAAGYFVTRVLADRGDEIEDILPDVSIAVLKKGETWDRIKKGDQSLPASVFRSAIDETCRLYELGPERPNHFYKIAQSIKQSLT